MGVYLGSKAVSVYNGGQMAPEEKTVTAGTSPIEVNATSGKLMSKVTVNPTPTEEKTVTPTTEDLIVAPVEGKQLSKVTVQGDANFLEENIAEGITIWGKTGTHQGGGGDVVNGIVESYLANTETIDANTFINFVGSGSYEPKIKTRITTTSYADSPVACKLTNNKIFVLYIDIVDNVYTLNGVIVSINNNEISVGTPIVIASDSNLCTSKRHCVTAITESKVIILYAIRPSSYVYNLYAIVATINDTIITKGSAYKFTDKTMSDGNTAFEDYYAYGAIDVVNLNDYNVFVTLSPTNGSNSKLGCSILTITGTSININAPVCLSDEYRSLELAKTIVLTKSLVFIAHYVNDGYIYGTLVNINGTVPSKIATSQICQAKYSKLDAELISNENGEYKILLTYNAKSSDYLTGVILTISGGTISIGSELTISDKVNSSHINMAAVRINNNNVFIVYSYGPDYEIYGSELSINGDIITINNTHIIGNQKYNTGLQMILLSTNQLFLIGRGIYSDYSSNISSILLEPENIKITEATTKIEGITKTVATTETPGEVWVLNSNT